MNPPTSQRVALTGGSGFVGRAVLAELLAAGHHVTALSRRAAIPEAHRTVRGDLFDDAALDDLLRGCDATVHLVGIIREQPARGQTFDRIHHQAVRRLAARASAAGVERFIHMSALGTRDGARSAYHRTKWLGEQAVRGGGMSFTIFRPSLILGPGGEFAQLMADLWTKRLPPCVPYFARGALGLGGSGKVQPIAVTDVARCMTLALTRDATRGETYELGGPEAMDWPTMYRRVKAILPDARRKPIMPVPAWWAKALASLSIVGPLLPFNRAQVVMAEEDSVCDTAAMRRDFGVEPLALEAALASRAI